MTASHTPAADSDLQRRAKTQFERRSARYQGSFSQRVYCRPTSRILLERFPFAPQVRVLDVGCGSGQLLADIRARCGTAHLHGLDLCPGMLQSAHTLLGAQATLVEGSGTSLPFPDQHFDAVVCTHCFHHFPDQARALREMARVLRPGGVALILDGDRDGLWGWLLYDVFVVMAEGPVRHLSGVDWDRTIRAAGFAQVSQVRAFPLSPVRLVIAYREGGARD